MLKDNQSIIPEDDIVFWELVGCEIKKDTLEMDSRIYKGKVEYHIAVLPEFTQSLES